MTRGHYWHLVVGGGQGWWSSTVNPHKIAIVSSPLEKVRTMTFLTIVHPCPAQHLSFHRCLIQISEWTFSFVTFPIFLHVSSLTGGSEIELSCLPLISGSDCKSGGLIKLCLIYIPFLFPSLMLEIFNSLENHSPNECLLNWSTNIYPLNGSQRRGFLE